MAGKFVFNPFSGTFDWTNTEVDTLATVMGRGATTGIQLVSTLATGTSPFAVTSTTKVVNLNSDLLDGLNVGTSHDAIPNLNADNSWGGQQTFGHATPAVILNNTAPQLDLGLAGTYKGQIQFRDSNGTAHVVNLYPAKLTTASYDVVFQDHAAGAVNPVYGSNGASSYVAYFSSGTNDIVGNKALSFSGSTLTVGSAGSQGVLSIATKNAVSSYTFSLQGSAAATATFTLITPVSLPANNSYATITTGGQIAYQALGLSVTITTAALTGGGTQGSMTFTNGVLTAQTPAT